MAFDDDVQEIRTVLACGTSAAVARACKFFARVLVSGATVVLRHKDGSEERWTPTSN